MTQENVTKCEVDKQMTIKDFLGMNPDMKKVLSDIVKTIQGARTVPKLLKALGAEQARPELLSMLACFSLDRGIRDSDLVDMDVAAWDDEANKLLRKHKICPHVALVCQAVRGSKE